MHPGDGAGLSQRFLGEESGTETVTLLTSEIPAHSHNVQVSRADSIERSPAAQLPAGGVGVGLYIDAQANGLVPLNFSAYPPAGGGLPHNNLQPYLVANFNIALQGVFPARP